MNDNATSFKGTHLTVVHDPLDKWLYATWSGLQTPDDIKNGGRQMVQSMRAAFTQFGTTKVLNDNLAVVGSWSHSIDWATREWFPTMFSSGLKRFAWVLSPDALASLSGYAVAVRSGAPVHTDAIHTFTTLDEGRAWLRSFRGERDDQVRG